MTAGRYIALLLGFVVIAFGVNGIRVGKVVVRSVRPPWPGYFHRDKEPVAFWTTVSLWICLGTFIVAGVLVSRVLV
jgi:hypothetical protein